MPDRRPLALLERFAPLVAGAVAFAVYLTTLSSHLLFGDAAESVAGVASLGILHAPGYATYVVLGKLFSVLVPVGGLPLRLALLSAVCAAASVGLLVATVRRLGFSWWGTIASAVALTCCLSFAFYATYAKSYAPTGLAIALLLWLAVRWSDDGRLSDLLAFGVVAGLSSGLSYQIVGTAAPGLLLLALWRRRPSARQWGALLGAGTIALVAVWGFTFVRAGQDPAFNYGGASTPERLARLALMKDFGVGDRRPDVSQPDQAPASATRATPTRGGNAVSRLASLPAMVANEVGLAAALLVAAGGIALVADPKRRVAGIALVLVLFGNAVVLAAVVFKSSRLGSTDGFAFRFGGFFFATDIAAALLAGAGVDGVARLAARRVERHKRSRAVRTDPRRFAVAGAGCLALVGVFAVGNLPAASHRAPAFASSYATDVLDSLPKRAVLFTWQAERNFPVLAEQIAAHHRRDVDVVLAEWILVPWYREQVGERLGIDLPQATTRDWFDETVTLADRLRGERPVYVDFGLLPYVADKVSVLQQGLVAELVPAGGVQTDVATTELRLRRSRAVGLYDDPARLEWPNDENLLAYAAAHTLLAEQLARQGDAAGAARHARLALRIDPSDRLGAKDLIRAADRG